MSGQSSRPWWRLHFATWTVLVFVGVAMFHKQCYVNNPLWMFPEVIGDGGLTTTDGLKLPFGWPTTYARCPQHDTFAHKGNRFWLRDWIWNIQTENAVDFSLANLTLDIAMSLLVIFGAAFTIERRFPHYAFRLKFTLKSLIAITAWVGICLYWVKQQSLYFWWVWFGPIVHTVVLQISIVGIALCCFAAMDIIGLVFNWVTRRRM